VVRTGPGARAYLMLAEGSRVKLGEAARFSLHTQSMQPEKSFRGALDVVAGAFRFTTGKLKKTLPREVAIRVGTATIGIRGTDIWGKTDKDGDLVALIEGRIEITRAGQSTETGAGHDLLRCTAWQGGRGEVRWTWRPSPNWRGRPTSWPVTAPPAKGASGHPAGAAASQEAALEIYDQARDAGFAARIRRAHTEGGGWRYEVAVAAMPARRKPKLRPPPEGHDGAQADVVAPLRAF
jgi:hypothetical protein